MEQQPIDYASPAPKRPMRASSKWTLIVLGLAGASVLTFIVLFVMHWRSLGSDWAP